MLVKLVAVAAPVQERSPEMFRGALIDADGKVSSALNKRMSTVPEAWLRVDNDGWENPICRLDADHC